MTGLGEQGAAVCLFVHPIGLSNPQKSPSLSRYLRLRFAQKQDQVRKGGHSFIFEHKENQKMTTKYSIRTDERTSEWIQSCYNLYRTEMVSNRMRPVSLNKFLISLITDSLQKDTPLRVDG